MAGVSSGPDRLLPADSFTTTDPRGAVKLRVGDTLHDDYDPVSVPTLLKKSVSSGGESTALAVKRDGAWVKWSYSQYLDDVRTVAKAFIKLGLQPRHGVGIIGFNSPEWFISDLASVHCGGMAAGIYPTNSPGACRYIMENCKANVLVAEDAKQLSKFVPFASELPYLKAVIQWTGQPDQEAKAALERKGRIKVMSWERMLELGRKEGSVEALEERLGQVAINECCHLVYTSGTTGNPKGVMLTHDNLTYTSRRLCEIFHMRTKEERLVSYLPLSHVAANICDLFVMLSCQGIVYFADKDALKGTLTNTLKEAQPTLFFGVPRVWEKIHEKMLAVGRQNKNFIHRQVGKWAKKTGLEHNKNLMNTVVAGAGQGGATGWALGSNLNYRLMNKAVFQKVKAALGLNRCLRFYVAAAPMAKEILEYFLSLDIKILEFYGMSECSGPQLCNIYETIRIGTNGRELPGFWHRLNPENGELLAMGRHVMMGYLGEEDKTREVFNEDGWLKSGDIGQEDPDGYVTVTGRIKELIITAGGENVPPVVIENEIKKELSDIVSNVVVVGDRRKFLTCLITLKCEVDLETQHPLPDLSCEAREWCESLGSKAVTVAEAADDQIVHREIQCGIDRANGRATSNAQRVQKFGVLPSDFSVDGGELGPTLKIKRHVVLERNAKVVERMYN